jgi:hypothetical protein
MLEKTSKIIIVVSLTPIKSIKTGNHAKVGVGCKHKHNDLITSPKCLLRLQNNKRINMIARVIIQLLINIETVEKIDCKKSSRIINLRNVCNTSNTLGNINELPIIHDASCHDNAIIANVFNVFNTELSL